MNFRKLNRSSKVGQYVIFIITQVYSNFAGSRNSPHCIMLLDIEHWLSLITTSIVYLLTVITWHEVTVDIPYTGLRVSTFTDTDNISTLSSR